MTGSRMEGKKFNEYAYLSKYCMLSKNPKCEGGYNFIAMELGPIMMCEKHYNYIMKRKEAEKQND